MAAAPSRLPPACSGFRVWPHPDHVLLEPLDGREETLKISRADGKVSRGEEPSLTGTTEPPFSACVLLGVIDLLSGPYILLATNSEVVGTLHGGYVFRITETKLLHAAPSLAGLTGAQRSDEAQYVVRLKKALQEHGLYYSFAVDITNRTQKRKALESAGKGPAEGPLLWQQADHRLVWNSALLSSIADSPEAAPYLIPVVQGSFQFIDSTLDEHKVRLSLIARRATSRIGTRMWRRGADSLGNVANFVETEQLLQTGEGWTASFVQVRGSIPVHWEQIVDLKYKPKIKTTGTHPGSSVPLHVFTLREDYGSVVALDLVNQKGGEKVIGSEYAVAVDVLHNKESKTAIKHSFTYVAFDFHKVCGHTKFERLETLYEQVAKTLQSQGYFLQDPSGKVVELQAGVARTNCVDCLDRTNVTQSLLGRKALEAQLRRLGVFKDGETVASHPPFNTRYKIAWADHGDDISKQYSGTGALKGDFVRFGKRSIQGLLQDGKNSMLRYVYNNFYDGVRQDGLDLVMGSYTVQKGKPSPFAKKGIEALTNLRVALGVLLVALIVFIMSVNDGLQGHREGWAYAGLSVAVMGVIGFSMKKYGKLYCDRPRLCALK